MEMNFFMMRLAIAMASLVLISGCPAKLDIEVFNNTSEDLLVSYAVSEVSIAPMTSRLIRVFVGNTELSVDTQSMQGRYSANLSDIPGNCFVYGLTYRLKLQIDSDGSLQVLDPDQEFPVQSGKCGSYTLNKDLPPEI